MQTDINFLYFTAVFLFLSKTYDRFEIMLEDNSLRKSIFLVIYTIGFLSLASVAIWDIKNIIVDYINENRLTLVKQMNITNRFPFLNQAHICLHYPPHFLPIIPVSFEDFRAIAKTYWLQQQINWPKDLSEGEKNVTINLLNLMLADRFIVFHDDYGPGGSEKVSDILNLSINRSEFIQIVDKFIENRENVKTTQQLRLEMLPFFVHKFDFTPVPAMLYSFDFQSVCVKILLPEELTISSLEHKQDYALDFARTNVAPTASVLVSFAEETFYYFKKESNFTTENILMITNHGVFDTTHFPPCTQEFENEKECLYQFKILDISDSCNCTPMSAVLTASVVAPNVRVHHQLPFCTTKMYEECWAIAEKKIEQNKKTAEAKELCKLCVSSKNGFERNQYQGELIPFWSPWYPRALVSFQCKDKMYLRFEDKPQFNFSQFVAQIGGDLGLYIGFSMISLLHFLLFLYRAYQKRNKTGNTNGNLFIKFFRFLVNLVTGDFDDPEQLQVANHTENKQDAPEENNANQYDSRLETLESQMQKLNTKVDLLISRNFGNSFQENFESHVKL